MTDETRLPYHAPVLTDHGTMRDLTQAGPSLTLGSDNIYVAGPGEGTPTLS